MMGMSFDVLLVLICCFVVGRRRIEKDSFTRTSQIVPTPGRVGHRWFVGSDVLGAVP